MSSSRLEDVRRPLLSRRNLGGGEELASQELGILTKRFSLYI